MGVMVRLFVREGPQQLHQVLVVQHLMFQKSLCQLPRERRGLGVRSGSVALPSPSGSGFLSELPQYELLPRQPFSGPEESYSHWHEWNAVIHLLLCQFEQPATCCRVFVRLCSGEERHAPPCCSCLPLPPGHRPGESPSASHLQLLSVVINQLVQWVDTYSPVDIFLNVMASAIRPPSSTHILSNSCRGDINI